MRLSEFQIEQIRKIARSIFGDDVKVVLFGSRVDDKARGGDIDLLIDSSHQDRMNFENKIEFLTNLKLSIGDQKIDVIYNKPADEISFGKGSKSITKNEIINKAFQEGVEL